MREKLIELLYNFYLDYNGYICDGCGTRVAERECATIADHLIANGVTVQKWIPVTERLPEDSCRVLTRSASGYIGTELYNKGRGQFECCGVWIPVTHWMPLPEPPKGE